MYVGYNVMGSVVAGECGISAGDGRRGGVSGGSSVAAAATGMTGVADPCEEWS
jgi:hypothetical protein